MKKVISKEEAVFLIEDEVYGEFKHEDGCPNDGKSGKLYRGCDVSFGYFSQCRTCGEDRYYTDIFEPKRAVALIRKLDLKPMPGGDERQSAAAIFLKMDGSYSVLLFSGSETKAQGTHDSDMGTAIVNAILNFLWPGEYRVE